MELSDVVVLGSILWGAIMTGATLHYRNEKIKYAFIIGMSMQLIKDIADKKATLEIKDGELKIRSSNGMEENTNGI